MYLCRSLSWNGKLCQHCEHPPCVDVCPTTASFRRADGILHISFLTLCDNDELGNEYHCLFYEGFTPLVASK